MKIQKVFSFWRIVFSFGWAETFSWQYTGKESCHIYIFSIHIIERDDNKALGVVIGPVALALGFVI